MHSYRPDIHRFPDLDLLRPAARPAMVPHGRSAPRAAGQLCLPRRQGGERAAEHQAVRVAQGPAELAVLGSRPEPAVPARLKMLVMS